MRRIILLCLVTFLTFSSTLSHAQGTYPPLFGIQDDEMIYDSSLRPKASEVGAKWVRLSVFWSDIEPNAPVGDKPIYYWDKYDSLFLDYRNLGLEVIALLGGFPSWAAANSYGPILRMEDFKRFIRDLAKRYDGSSGIPEVLFFEFFNEPDLVSEEKATAGWGYWSQNGGGIGADYAQMLTEIYPEVKAANPNAMVVLGGLALEDIGQDSQGRDFFNLNFLDNVLSAGGGNYFDVMNFHYYTPFAYVWQGYGQDILGKAAYVRNVFAAHGVPAKPVFVTEAGEWSSSLDQCAYFFTRSEEIQAEYVVKLHTRALSDTTMKAVIWFVIQDKPEWNPCDGTRGLLRADGSQKLAYQVYKTVSNLLQGTSYIGLLSGVDEGYRFFAGGRNYIYVLWNDSGSRFVRLYIPSNQVTQIDKTGNQQQLVFPVLGHNYEFIVGPDPFYIVFEELPPETVSTPNAPTGVNIGSISTSYLFTTGGSTSNFGDPVEYQFDWKGDGSSLSEWGSSTQSMTFTSPGTYFIRARARCSWDPSVISFWSPTLTVRILPPPPAVDNPPFGSFDIPLPNATISGPVQVGGWALDDVGVTKIELRSDIPFWPYLGDLYYVCGTRPDVKAVYPNYPNNDCAGWGINWLTNFMSDYRDANGNRILEGSTHQYYLRIYDTAGHFVDVGHRNITIRNDGGVNPFGAIDGPSPGEIVSGPVNVVGWALARVGQRVSRVLIALGGQVLGEAAYGLYRPDVEAAFPGYADSGGSGFVYVLDTTLFSNGMYELIGVGIDEANHQDGIGSRWIYIRN